MFQKDERWTDVRGRSRNLDDPARDGWRGRDDDRQHGHEGAAVASSDERMVDGSWTPSTCWMSQQQRVPIVVCAGTCASPTAAAGQQHARSTAAVMRHR